MMKRHHTVSRSRHAGLSTLSLLALLTGCGGADGGSVATDAPAPPVNVTGPGSSSVAAPFDLDAVVRHVHFGYRAEDDAFAGGDVTYSVRVDGDGKVAVAPHILRAAADVPEGAAPAPVAMAAALTIETIAAERSGVPLRGDVARSEVDRDGSLVVHRESFDERLHNEPEGVEQSWTFAEAPRGHGDLTLHVRASGQGFTEATDDGLHFSDAASGVGLRYGLATWVDASGKRTTLRPRYEGGEVVLTVPASVVDASAYPAVLDPILTPEFGTDNPVYKPGSAFCNRQWNSAVSFDGTNYLVVWEDYRNGRIDIYGTRINASGVALDPAGIPIATALDDEILPKVAFNGTSYLVVWENDHITSYYGPTYATSIRGGRVSKSGAVLSNFTISSTSNPELPDIAFDGTNYLVVWQSALGIRGGRVSGAGARIDGEGFSVSTTDSWQESPAVACDPINCLVVWGDYRNGNYYDIYGARVSHAGASINWPDGFPINLGMHDSVPTVAWGAGTYNVAWAQVGADSVQRIRYTAVTAAGVPVTPDGNDISWFSSDRPRMTFGNSSFIVVYSGQWYSYSGTWVTGLPTSSKITGTYLFANNGGVNPVAVWGGTELLIENDVEEGAPYNNTRIRGILASFQDIFP